MNNSTLNNYDDLQSDDFTTSFDDALAEMQSTEDSLPSDVVLYGLANISPSDKDKFGSIWASKDIAYRRILLQSLIEIVDAEYQYDYQVVGELALRDADETTRQLAIELIAENDSLELMQTFIDIIQNDPSNAVRVEAIRALGIFIRKGELDDIPQSSTLPARQMVFSLLTNTEESLDIRRFALQSAAHCTDDRLPPHIQAAYQSNDENLQRSAIIAMGNSCDERWTTIILEELNNEDVDIRIEAARAAGAIEIEEAIPQLELMLIDTDRDSQIAAVNALGEIGGERAIYMLERAFEVAEDMEDEIMLDIIDEAMTKAQFMSGYDMLGDFDFSDDLDD